MYSVEEKEKDVAETGGEILKTPESEKAGGNRKVGNAHMKDGKGMQAHVRWGGKSRARGMETIGLGKGRGKLSERPGPRKKKRNTLLRRYPGRS